jgi:hypothetical protein
VDATVLLLAVDQPDQVVAGQIDLVVKAIFSIEIGYVWEGQD